MRTLGITCIAVTFTAIAACSAGDTPSAVEGTNDSALHEDNETAAPDGDATSAVDETGQTSAALRARPGRPGRPVPPPRDPCATVRCAAGTHCEATGRRAVCAPDPINPCAATLCPVGSLCEVIDGEGVCTPVAPPSGPFCGGIAGFTCPGAGTCEDDPSDDCDPAQGGADCGGVCTCGDVLALCIEGTVFDTSPEVCACVPQENPCNLADCPPDRPRCEVSPEGEAVCVAEPAPAPFCGGIAGFPCPGLGSCGDDPSDDCDPEQGGADCGGVCSCLALALCVEGFTFDDSPAVCDCVPVESEPNPCAAALCPINTVCENVNGEAVCTPIEPVDPCATVRCAAGTRCVARGDEAHCVPRGRQCSHRR